MKNELKTVGLNINFLLTSQACHEQQTGFTQKIFKFVFTCGLN